GRLLRTNLVFVAGALPRSVLRWQDGAVHPRGARRGVRRIGLQTRRRGEASARSWWRRPGRSPPSFSGITGNYDSFCASGAREYDESTDAGVMMNFWDNKTNETACLNRMMAVQSEFSRLYPNMPASIDAPVCDA
ncbi:unnamed protein product, partial [Prorocentrum cordatum]